MPANNPAFVPTTMESLALPAELYWEGKMEENSLSSSELFSVVDYSLAENWMDEDNIEIEIVNEDDLKLKLNLDDVACELINGDDIVMELCNLKDEHWNNTKLHTNTNTAAYIDDGILETPCLSPQQLNTSLTKVEFPNSLDSVVGLSEITAGSVIDLYAPVSANFDTAVLTQLTPPHSPPLQNTNATINISQHFISPGSNFIQQSPQILTATQNQQNATTYTWLQGASIAAPVPAPSFNELQTQIVDEIVNTRAQELQDWHDEFESLSTSSSSSLAGSSLLADESVTDEDWLPSSEYFVGSSVSSASTSPHYVQNNNNNDDMNTEHNQQHGEVNSSGSSRSQSPIKAQKKRTRPYGRAVEDRKVRKKEQNKNAATRYRQKKKLEMEVVLTEEQRLLARHDELQDELAERQREAKYLKTLILEFYNKQKKLKQQQKQQQ